MNFINHDSQIMNQYRMIIHNQRLNPNELANQRICIRKNQNYSYKKNIFHEYLK